VKINCMNDVHGRGRAPMPEQTRAKINEETANCMRELLKKCFREGPEAAARAQSAFRESVQLEETGGYGGWGPEAMRWHEFRERWFGVVREKAPQPFATVDACEGVDFSRALHRGRGRSM
jgi:hypothetical protein